MPTYVLQWTECHRVEIDADTMEGAMALWKGVANIWFEEVEKRGADVFRTHGKDMLKYSVELEKGD